ncbi:response regulator [Candidatus Woesearchaeota archaeon]|nr:response regulator [Candidatus Woesearchaeota archaeon]
MVKKVMIVEDSNLMASVISNFIKRSGKELQIITAHSGEESVEIYKSEKPDLVFMDIKMPGMDGITALEKIKQIDANAKVVMCTSLKDTESEERSKKAGCVGYIMKPFNSNDILDALDKNV